jgi:hypothetical protein
MRTVEEVLVGRSERKRPVRLLVWEDNIESDLKELGCEHVNWVDLAHDGV